MLFYIVFFFKKQIVYCVMSIEIYGFYLCCTVQRFTLYIC